MTINVLATGACGNDRVDHPLRLDHRDSLRGGLGAGPRGDSADAAQGRPRFRKLEGELGGEGDGMVPYRSYIYIYYIHSF